MIKFPDNFTWGAATSAYQIEGARDQDGCGQSTWDTFCNWPGHVREGHNASVACDHYHRYREDVALMAELGMKAYRLSISWPRVMPQGTGAVNEKGLAYYDRLIDCLLEHGITPWVTLAHWDYPYQLFLRGGWLSPDSPKWFADYTRVIVEKLSDRVSHWVTLNEPQCIVGLGYKSGEHAPGLKLDLPEVLLAGHHVLLAHGMATQTIRAHARTAPLVGWSPAASIYYPESASQQDIEAARTATRAVYPNEVWNNRWWSDPVILGHYPERGLRAYGSAAPKPAAGDMETIAQKPDFYLCNAFQGTRVKADADGQPVLAPLPPGHPNTLYLWHQTPEVLYWGPLFLQEMYGLPVVIGESGMSATDILTRDGRVRDQERIEFITAHLLQLKRAIDDGIDVRGYFYWSAMDNFEWSEGYRHRFGLIHVDYQTQKRTPKDSAYWYREIIKSAGGALAPFAPEDHEPQPYVIKETLNYINTHIAEPFNVKSIAARLRCHPDFLSRKFKSHMNIDLGAWIRRCRIERARDLLSRSDAQIDDVAEQCGFSDRIHFTKVFRKLTGQTPGQYQRRQREQEPDRPPALPALQPTPNPRANPN